MLLADVIGGINPQRQDRSYPRVVKRKMSNFPVKRAEHRQQRGTSRPPSSMITIAPPSTTGHRRRPAVIT